MGMGDIFGGASNLLSGTIGNLDPMNKLIDVGAGLLGLDPKIRDAVKIVAGVATGNVVTAVIGATDLAGRVAGDAEEAAATELAHSSEQKLAGSGYPSTSTIRSGSRSSPEPSRTRESWRSWKPTATAAGTSSSGGSPRAFWSPIK